MLSQMLKKYTMLCLLCLMLVVSCQKKAIQLPVIPISGISEIQNHSSIWIFAEKVDGKIVPRLNKNNKILNTHWIFNIDRHLSMGQVLPLLIQMQENKNKDSMHKKEGMKSYFSYADTAENQISLIPFPQTNFQTRPSPITDDLKTNNDPCSVLLEIKGDEVLFDRQILSLETCIAALEQRESCTSPDELKIVLAYSSDTSYQQYLQVKSFLHSREIACGPIEYLYTVK